MIEYSKLRILVLEILKDEPATQISTIIIKIHELAAKRNIFPSEEECKKNKIDYRYYRDNKLNPLDELLAMQIIWDLFLDRIITIGKDLSNMELPHIRLTEFGSRVVEAEEHIYYDPFKYIDTLKTFVPEVDAVILQYIEEGINCFRQHLFFASAVMFGAAAEKTTLLLLKAIDRYEKDEEIKKEICKLIEFPRMPMIFKFIQKRLKILIKNKEIPYTIHQGCIEHLLSLFEMIRVYRNDSVHNEMLEINPNKIALVVQGFPAAIETTYRLMSWFSENS